MIANGDFEAPTPSPWVLQGSAGVTDLAAHGGAQSLSLYAQYSSFGPVVVESRAHQLSVAATPGQSKQIFFWVNPDLGGSRPELRVAIDLQGGTAFTHLVFRAKRHELPAGWSYQQTASFVPLASTVGVQFETPQNWGPINGSGTFFVDDVADEYVPEVVEDMRKRLFFAALKQVVSGIAGPASGYASNLSGRVYQVMVTPETDSEIASPFVCLVNLGGGDFGDANASVAERTFTVRIYGFVRETASNRFASGIAETLADLEDDLVKALMQNRTILGTVQSSRIVSQESSSGLGPGDDYGEVEIVLECKQWVSPEVLQP